MMEYYAGILEEDFLMKKAKTNKRISISLDNISILDDDEYTSLYAYFMYEGCATNFEWRFTCSCYLMLLHDQNPIRFKEKFVSAFFKVYGSCDSQVFCEDYIDLGGLLIVCDFDVYKQLLKLSVNSSVDEIKQDAIACMDDTYSEYKEELFVKQLLDEYSEFKRKLGID